MDKQFKKLRNMIKSILRLTRPKQWIKNMFVFIPMFFGGELFDLHSVWLAVLTFFAFSMVASSIYCYNDIVDVDADRHHPVKCLRPIASGEVSIRLGYILMTLTFCLGMGILLLLPPEVMSQVMAVIVFYYVLNLAYCSKLKQFAILDVCIVAFGFVLRILAGGFACELALSNWIVIMTFLLTLFMSFAKRRDDVLRMNSTGEAPRKNTVRYNLTFINQAITITASVTLVCYIMYCVSPEVTERFDTPYLYLTFVFVLLGLLRYIQIAVVDEKSGDPTKIILHDHFSQIIVVAWILSFLLMIYVI
uniref:decaprenyl-phosphate phosphoribosyltransferase n=1 Tax=Prevotella sp. TaxID=59823 RepID=UPI00307B84FF